MWLLLVRDLRFRRSRIILTSLGTGLVLTMVLIVTGISGGFDAAARDTVTTLHQGPWLLPEGVTGPFTSASAFPVSELGDLPPDVEATPTAITRSVALDENAVSQDVVLIGLPVGTIVGGQMVSELLITSEEAGFEGGSEITVGGRLANVADGVPGLTLFAGTPIVIAPLPFVQAAVFEGADVATAAFLSGRPVPAPRGFAVLSRDAVIADSLRSVSDANDTIAIVRVLLLLVAAILIGAVVYVSALERRREFALLKAVGARGRRLMVGVLTQALVIATIGSFIAVVLEVLLSGAFPMAVSVDGADYLTLAVITVISAAAASLVGLRHILGVRATDALDDR
ncbi:FtsX-like permease family protein [Euzebya tangerina]|uniref:FtsX-like permease family protein n=1 Tax=Euzebya tangerina TaxID=591198 RepID=UPI000E315F2E|nr:ABC transporter permease [Euzebya tangerina]